MAFELKSLNRARAAILASLASDAFSLSYSWVYDVSKITRPIEPKLQAPQAKFHADKGKVKGDLTHIGDQSVILLESLHEKKRFDLNDYAARFRKLFNDEYKGWKTGYTRETLKQLESGVPLSDVGPAIGDTDPLGRIAPLLLVYDKLEDFLPAAQQLVSFTNRTPLVLESTAFFSHVLFKVLGGKTPVAAIRETIATEPFSKSEFLTKSVKAGLDSQGEDTTAVIKRFGASCEIEAGVPNSIHLIAKYEKDLTAANEANVGAGGDSSARGLLVGTILGAYLGAEGLPVYTKDFTTYDRVIKILAAKQ